MISKQEVEHIAKLARLGLSNKEIKKFQKDISEILDYFKLLEKADVSKVEPFFHPAESYFGKQETMRQDKSEEKEIAYKLLELAPDKEKKYIKAKSVFK